MKLKYLSLILSSMCVIQFTATERVVNAQEQVADTKVVATGQTNIGDIQNVNEYKGYIWRIDA